MTELPNYTIELRGIGEEVVYREEGREYHFVVGWRANAPTIYDDNYWDGMSNSPRGPLNKELHKRIIPRIYDFLNTWGERTPVGVVFSKNPQTGAYDRVS